MPPLLLITLLLLSLVSLLLSPASSSSPPPPSLSSSTIHKLKSSNTLPPAGLASLDVQVSSLNRLLPLTPDLPHLLEPQVLIALPLDASFDPPPTSFSHGHILDGDKVSLPSKYWTAIRGPPMVEVPWIVEISRIDTPLSPAAAAGETPLTTTSPASPLTPHRHSPPSTSPPTPRSHSPSSQTSLFASPLDFRSPSTAVFLPPWMFRALGLRPGEPVLVGLRKDPAPGGKVTVRPLHFKNLPSTHMSEASDSVPVGSGLDFLKIASPQSVLETSLKHYSTLSSLTTISLCYNDKRYYFDVIECKDSSGRKADAVKVQDTDLQFEFVRCRTVK